MKPEQFWTLEVFAGAAYLLRCNFDLGTVAAKLGCLRGELVAFLDTGGYMEAFKAFYAEHELEVDRLIELIAKPSDWPESKRHLIEHDKEEL